MERSCVTMQESSCQAAAKWIIDHLVDGKWIIWSAIFLPWMMYLHDMLACNTFLLFLISLQQASWKMIRENWGFPYSFYSFWKSLFQILRYFSYIVWQLNPTTFGGARERETKLISEARGTTFTSNIGCLQEELFLFQFAFCPIVGSRCAWQWNLHICESPYSHLLLLHLCLCLNFISSLCVYYSAILQPHPLQ